MLRIYFRFLFFVSVGFWGCSGPVDPVEPEPCGVSIASTWPEHLATDAHYLQDIEFHLSESVEDAVIITDLEGTQWMRDDGKTIGFTPLEPLKAQTSYTMGLEYCAGSPEISFTTNSHGIAVTDLAFLQDTTFMVDLADARFAEGGGVADILLSLFDRQVLFQFTSVTESAIGFNFSVAKQGTAFPEQDTCFRTMALEDVDFDNPMFLLEADLLQFDAFLAALSLRDFYVSGSVGPDGLSLAGISFEMTMDLREVTDVLGVNNYEEVCSLAANVGSNCRPCPQDNVESCITVSAMAIEGTVVPVEIETIEVANTHPDCDKADEE
jgi:hypothetical protein